MKVGNNKKLERIARRALILMPQAKWIIQDEPRGHWYAHESELVYDYYLEAWYNSKSGLRMCYVCTTKPLKNQVKAYEISKLLANEQN